ncbi:MAG TPA: hypothetical protein VNZ02_01905 [Steroidobacteraceae bacterium]|jgi:hypothetical protein|nr:hypothetical protein [Steroidobacteraceae bacterium]
MLVPDGVVTNLSTFIAGAGALGTACFGIIEGLKWTSLGEAGFGQIIKYLGPELLDALKIAYGPQYQKLLRAQYRQDSQTQAAIAKTLRQGVRIGLTTTNAASIAGFLGSVDAAALTSAAGSVAKGANLTGDDRAAIGRFELTVDARIDSALSSAQDVYLGTLRCVAALLAVGIAEAVVAIPGVVTGATWATALLLGIVAVPFAPIANDLVGALQAATKALKAR